MAGRFRSKRSPEICSKFRTFSFDLSTKFMAGKCPEISCGNFQESHCFFSGNFPNDCAGNFPTENPTVNYDRAESGVRQQQSLRGIGQYLATRYYVMASWFYLSRRTHV